MARPRLEAAAREWIHETAELLRELREDVYLETGGIARSFRREILLIHVRRAEKLLEGETPETNAADALRDAVLWLDTMREDGHELEEPRWYRWALRILPRASVSRWARMARRAAEVDA